MSAFLDHLHTLPDLLILFLCIAVIVGAAMAAPLFGKRVLGLTPSASRDTAAFDAYKAILAMVGIVLAFSVVQVNSNLRNEEVIAGREGTLLVTVDRILFRLDNPKAPAVRALLADFGKSLIDDEWPALRQDRRSPVTDQKFAALSHAARSIEPTDTKQAGNYAELQKALDDLSDTREALIQDTGINLPTFFWSVTLAFLAASLFLALLTEVSWTRAAGLGGTAAGVALLLSFVLIVDQPFKGETSVSPKDIEKALVLNSRRS